MSVLVTFLWYYKYSIQKFKSNFLLPTFNQSHLKHIGGVIVSMLVSSAVDQDLEIRCDQTKGYKNGI